MANKNEKYNHRPPAYDSPEEMQGKIDAYFNGGMKKRTVYVGKDKIPMQVEVPTITGLCNFLGFESRQSFYDYEKKEDFTYIIKKARQRIEQEYEELLQWGNTVGAIFVLKNMGWSDKQELEMSGNLATDNTHTLKNINDWYDKHRDDKGQ